MFSSWLHCRETLEQSTASTMWPFLQPVEVWTTLWLTQLTQARSASSSSRRTILGRATSFCWKKWKCGGKKQRRGLQRECCQKQVFVGSTLEINNFSHILHSASNTFATRNASYAGSILRQAAKNVQCISEQQ